MKIKINIRKENIYFSQFVWTFINKNKNKPDTTKMFFTDYSCFITNSNANVKRWKTV